MSRYLRLSLACLLFLFLPISMAAQAPPSADTYVTKFSPSTNFGSAPILAVQEGTTTYIQFDLSALPEGAKIAKATLRLYVNNVLVPGSFDVYQVNEAWSEKVLTYNNAPPLGTSATGGNPVNISASSLNHFIVVDITPLARDWLSGTLPNYGVALALAAGTANPGSFSFDSKENPFTGHQPDLAIVLEGGCHAAQTHPGWEYPQCLEGDSWKNLCCQCANVGWNQFGPHPEGYWCYDVEISTAQADEDAYRTGCSDTCHEMGHPFLLGYKGKGKCPPEP
jgi:hypothetical protein